MIWYENLIYNANLQSDWLETPDLVRNVIGFIPISLAHIFASFSELRKAFHKRFEVLESLFSPVSNKFVIKIFPVLQIVGHKG